MVSLEIPYYPCLFGQTKSVPGIKYRILGDGENNYYESFKSVMVEASTTLMQCLKTFTR